jgi:tetratricopeptide (TPR) repeat protein
MKAVRPWTALKLPSGLTGMRSMLSHEEKQYLTWLTAERYEGWGAIVDLGPWLGSSSASLAEGLRRCGKPAKVRSFDLFRWEPSYMEAIAHEQLPEGADFLPSFTREIGGYSPWIEARKQDLMQYSWQGGPIEILFVDAAKSWELTNAILRGFGTNLVPGRSRIVLQDFRYFETHWLPLIFDSRPDLWQEIESVKQGTTVTFHPLKALDGPGGIQSDYSEDTFPLAVAEPILRNRMAREDQANRSLLLRALYRKVLAEGTPEAVHAAREELHRARLPAAELQSLQRVWTMLVPLGWKAYDRHDYRKARMLAERCFLGNAERPVYAVVLLGLSLLRLGDLEGARACIEEAYSRLPEFLPAKLYRAELAVAEGRYRDAEADSLDVLKGSGGDDTHTDYALTVLEQAWAGEERWEHARKLLHSLRDSLGARPAFLTALARVQLKGGWRAEARESIAEALRIRPDYHPASSLQAELDEE